MHIIKLNFTGKNVGSEEFLESADSYMRSLYGSKQIINEEFPYDIIDNGLSVNLYCPEPDSFEEKNSTEYGKSWRKKIEEELECKLEFVYKGLHPELDKFNIHTKWEFLILRSNYLSPLYEGKSFEPIPLYKIPYTYHDKKCYNDINFWENNYGRVYGLWFNGAVGERWAQNQLQIHNSELSKQGIECCKRIEELTKVPTYYFLFNYRAWGRKKDAAWKCPSCNGDWLIENKTFNDNFAFKCDDCRLISELSSNK